jgi:hypothetical protein
VCEEQKEASECKLEVEYAGEDAILFCWQKFSRVSTVVDSCSKINRKQNFENFYLLGHARSRVGATESVFVNKCNYAKALEVVVAEHAGLVLQERQREEERGRGGRERKRKEKARAQMC